MKNKKRLQKIAIGGLTAALVCVSTAIIQIPIPLGYMHFGNICILLFSFLFPWDIALFAGGVGSALADLLTGFPQWAIPTLLIKSIMGLLASLVYHGKENRAKIKSINSILGSLVGAIIMIAGYTVAGAIMYGNIPEGLAQIPGLTTEGVLGIVGFYILAVALEKVHIHKYLPFS